MLIKQKQIESGIRNQVKAVLKSKIPHFTISKKKPPKQKDKKSTIIPSYQQIDKVIEDEISHNLNIIINKQSYMVLRKQIKSKYVRTDYEDDSQRQNKIKKDTRRMMDEVIGQRQGHQSVTRVMGCMLDEDNLPQLWAFIPQKQYPPFVYIMHVESGLALRLFEHKIVLAPKLRIKQCLFSLEVRSGVKSLYEHSIYIQCYMNLKNLSLKGALVCSEAQQYDQCQQFYIKKIGLYQSHNLRETFILSNPQTKRLCLSANIKKQLIQYRQMDFALDQRWLIVPGLHKINIRNSQLNQKEIQYRNRGQMRKEQKQDQDDTKQRDENDQTDRRRNQNRQNNQNQQNKKNSKPDSRFECLHQKDLQIIQTMSDNLVKQLDCQRYAILNYKLNRSLTVMNSQTRHAYKYSHPERYQTQNKNQNDDSQKHRYSKLKNSENKKSQYSLYFAPLTPKRQWLIQYDGFSMKIMHSQLKMYLSVQQNQIKLRKQAQYWKIQK